MSRHRNVKHMMDEYDDEELEEEEYYISLVMQKVGKKVARKKVFNALEETNWVVEEAVKLLKAPPPAPAKPVAPQQKAPEEKKTQIPINLDIDYPDVHPPEDIQGKPTINLVVIGHVDAGKSTLMGHLLYRLGYIDPRTMRRYEKESHEIGKDSFHYAWVLDGDSEERQRGVTIDIGFNTFSTPNREIVIIDAPGHLDFVPKMITGAAQADAAILVIDSVPGNFERGFEGERYHGQTKEHSFIARSLGVNHLIVAVNKLDVSGWDQGRFEQIRGILTPFLHRVGYKDSVISYIPLSGLHGTNLDTCSGTPDWYSGPSLVDLIDNIPPPVREICKPLRFCLVDSYKLTHGSIIGQAISGKVESGQVRINDRVIIEPVRAEGTVKSIEKAGELVDRALAGDNVDIGLRDLSGDFSLVMPGNVVYSGNFPVPQVECFILKVITFDLPYPVTKGQKLLMHLQSSKVSVTVSKILRHTDLASGQVIKERPRFLPKFSSGVVEIRADSKVCIEKHSNVRGLGRVTLREEANTVMAGIVIQLIS